MKARGEKRYPLVGAVLAERTEAFSPNCARLCRNGAKEGLKGLRRFSARLALLSAKKSLQNGVGKV